MQTKKIKLGLKIVGANQGANDYVIINDGSWSQATHELRGRYITHIKDFMTTTNNAVLVYETCNQGEFIIVLSANPERINDYVAGWIFIPYNTEISGDALQSIVEKVKVEVLGNPTDERIRPVFEKEYDSCSVPNNYVKTSGDGFAVRYYGTGKNYSLSEILGGLSQKGNDKFKCIFIIDNASGIRATDDCIDISDSEIVKYVTVNNPPEMVGFKPYDEYGMPFTRPKKAIPNSSMRLIYKKDGYKDIPRNVAVGPNGGELTVDEITTNEINRRITRDHFVIMEGGNVLSRCTITINGNTLMGNEQYVPESIIKDCRITVSREGYTTYVGMDDLRYKVNIHMKKEMNSYKFKIPLEIDGYGEPSYGIVQFETREKLHECPIVGYTANGMLNRGGEVTLKCEIKRMIGDAIEKRHNAWKKRILITSLIALLLGLVAGGIVGYLLTNNKQTDDPVEVTTSINQPSPQESQSKEGPLEKAADYLDSHDKWKKSEMEEYAELKGLWDEMNNLEYEKILSHNDLSTTSEKFKELVNQISAFKNHEGYESAIRGPWCKKDENDDVIDFINYKNKIKIKSDELGNKASESKSSSSNQSRNSKDDPSTEEKLRGMLNP